MTPTPTIPAVCRAAVGAPAIAQAPFTILPGSSDCGGVKLSPAPAAPLSGQVADGSGNPIGSLGLGCLYVGPLPPTKLPDGATSILDVTGVGTGTVTLGGSAGNGPSDCTLGAGPGRHCVNDSPGADGSGTCNSDADCQPSTPGGFVTGACQLDANCYFGPPIPVVNGILSTCAVNVFLSDLCGSANLVTLDTTLSTTLASRLYLTGDAQLPCPQCIAGTCSRGKNAGQPCTAVGSANTSVDCPPDESKFLGSLFVEFPALSTASSTTSDPDGLFCPNQTNAGAFGLSAARSVTESGTAASLSGSSLQMSLAGNFCVPKTNGFVDQVASLPALGGVSVKGSLDLSGVLPLVP